MKHDGPLNKREVSPLIKRSLVTQVVNVMFLQLSSLAPLDRLVFNLRFYSNLYQVPNRRNWLPHNFRDGGKVKNWPRSLTLITCAESKKQEVVDELLILSHAKFLRRKSTFHVKVPNPQALVSDAFRHKLMLKVTIFDRNSMKNLRGIISPKTPNQTSVPSVKGTLPSAGNPTVPLSGLGCSSVMR